MMQTMATKPKRVIIMGGGVAGLSAAHELMERGFEVHIYEYRSEVGGKARSMFEDGLPAEHGFRFFPGFYRHVIDTMSRIPSPTGGKVSDHLQTATRLAMARRAEAPIISAAEFPHNLADLRVSLRAMFTNELPVSLKEIEMFSARMWQLLTSCAHRRRDEYDKISWWNYMGAEERSETYKKYFVIGLTRTLVAAKAEEISTKTGGNILIQLMLDMLNPIARMDRLLDGPTSDVWLTPWHDYLTDATRHSEGRIPVSIHTDYALQEIRCVNGSIDGVVVCKRLVTGSNPCGPTLSSPHLSENSDTSPQPTRDACDFLLSPKAAARVAKGTAPAVLPDLASGSSGTACGTSAEPEGTATQTEPPPTTEGGDLGSGFTAGAGELIQGDYYIAALPVEVMSEHLTSEILQADPTLCCIDILQSHVRWMNGIQFYLTEDVPLIHGHTTYIDTPWALTSISQRQFWRGIDFADYGEGELKGRVKGILSVDVSDWNTPGLVPPLTPATSDQTARQSGSITPTDFPPLASWISLPASQCTSLQVAAGVWQQLKQHINVGGQVVLRDEMLCHYFLCPDHIYTVKEQPPIHGEAEAGEPLLVNAVGTWGMRPDAFTQIPNLFLASDYVRTFTDLATMEGANEAARRAVNRILQASKSNQAFCRLWDLHEPVILAPLRFLDYQRYMRGLSWSFHIPPKILLAGFLAVRAILYLIFSLLGIKRAPIPWPDEPDRS